MSERALVLQWRSAVLNSQQLTPTQKLVLLALAEYAASDGSNARPLESSLAFLTRLGKSTIRRSLVAAESCGWITKFNPEKGSGLGQAWRRNEWQLEIPDDADCTTARKRTKERDA
jgi:hypothetical protein